MTKEENFYEQCMEELHQMNAIDNFMFNELVMQEGRAVCKSGFGTDYWN